MCEVLSHELRSYWLDDAIHSLTCIICLEGKLFLCEF